MVVCMSGRVMNPHIILPAVQVMSTMVPDITDTDIDDIYLSLTERVRNFIYLFNHIAHWDRDGKHRARCVSASSTSSQS